MEGPDDVIHQPVRLRVMAALTALAPDEEGLDQDAHGHHRRQLAERPDRDQRHHRHRIYLSAAEPRCNIQ